MEKIVKFSGRWGLRPHTPNNLLRLGTGDPSVVARGKVGVSAQMRRPWGRINPHF